MKTEGVLGKGFRQEVGVLVNRLYVRYFKLSILNMLSQKVVTHTDVFRVRVRHGVNCHLDRTLTFPRKPGCTGPQNQAVENATRAARKRILKAFCHCNVLGLTRGEFGALLCQRNPLDCRTPAHHGYIQDRPLLRILGGISGVHVNHQL